jgi:hypothetical protein
MRKLLVVSNLCYFKESFGDERSWRAPKINGRERTSTDNNGQTTDRAR